MRIRDGSRIKVKDGGREYFGVAHEVKGSQVHATIYRDKLHGGDYTAWIPQGQIKKVVRY